MDEAVFERLEFDKVLDRLVGYCGSPEGRRLAGGITVSRDTAVIRRRLAETSEARSFLEKRPPAWEFGSVPDLREALAAAAGGAVLEPVELHGVKTALDFGESVRASCPPADKFPAVASIAGSLFTAPDVAREIGRAVDAEGSVLDGASVELGRVRRRIRDLEKRIPSELRNFVNDSRNSSLVQERIVTVRNGRYVVPVRAERAGGDKFVLQDRSASGATSFVEPLHVVELNNRLAGERIAERNEVLRVLRALTLRVGEIADGVAGMCASLASLDLLIARGRLSIEMRGCEPMTPGGDEIRIRGGRHPLLEGRPVPVDLTLGGETRALVLTGPNAGGKTVALKMAGLFTIMAQAGLHVPALDGTELPVFADVHAVIGDEQSIERSLSTFTSHLTDTGEILRGAGRGSLVLIDEICSGTDPAEGTALACAVLKKLMDAGAVCMATSHHGGLKTFASVTPDARNARVLFDETRGEPRFIIEAGIAGRSHALEVAARAGIPGAVVDSARGYLDAQTQMAESMMAELEHLKGALAVERDALEREKELIAGDKERAKKELGEAAKKKTEVIARAMAEAEGLIEQTRGKMRELLDRAHSAEKLPEKARVKGEFGKIREGVREAAVRTAPKGGGRPITASDLTAGKALLLKDSGQVVEFLSGPDRKGRVRVQLGGLPMTTPLRNLAVPDGHSARLAAPTRRAPAKQYDRYIDDAKNRARTSVDLRGMRAAEALENLEAEIMTLNVAGVREFIIVHGIGTGALMAAVHEYLRSNSFVSRFEPAPLDRGGIGATIVFLS